jgi:acyl-coenzyme A synthetase/AMP-(fatty) acid ligase
VVLNNKTVIDKNFWNVIKKYKVNSFGGVPEFYEYLKRIDFEKRITKSIKYLTQAGGKLEEKTLGYFGKICKKNKVKFYVMYGQAEASPRMTYLKWEKFFSKINSIGKPLKGYKIKLVDKNRKVINKTNTKGEIMFSGRNVSLGYAKNFNDLTKDDENKRTLFTGDLAIRDRENYLYIVGRKNRIIKLFGRRFDLDDIENFFKSKGIKAKCKFNNSKIILNLPLNSNTESEINSLSNFLGINRNFIVVNKNLNRSFKDY